MEPQISLLLKMDHISAVTSSKSLVSYITHSTTSPYHAQSNTQTERMVQTLKRLINKSQDPYLLLLRYRNTSIDGIDMYPAQLFLGRRLRSILPTIVPLLKSCVYNNTLVKMKCRQENRRRTLTDMLRRN